MRVLDFTVTQSESGKTIRDFLKHKSFSSAVSTLLKKHDNGIALNGERAFTNAILKVNDKIKITVHDVESEIMPENLKFKIVYEDEDILVYDKPAGVVVHPTKVYQSGTLGNDYAYRCKVNNEQCTFRPVYRIDRNTSGLVLIAKNKLAACVKVDKKYICICNGIIAEQGIFDGKIALCENSKIKREVADNGKLALTEYRRLCHSESYSLCEVALKTGRTHQIRVHFSNAGHSLVGDDLYGPPNMELKRHALHCSYISFINPITHNHIELTSDVPNDMQQFINKNNIL